MRRTEESSKMNAVYGEFFKVPYPARAVMQVARLTKNVKVEIEAIAKKLTLFLFHE